MEPIPLVKELGIDDLMLCYIGSPIDITPLPVIFTPGNDNPAGIHSTCAGFLDVILVSPNEKAIKCRRCHLEVRIPSNINTYGELSKHFTRKR